MASGRKGKKAPRGKGRLFYFGSSVTGYGITAAVTPVCDAAVPT
jgi:hypothetical protein